MTRATRSLSVSLAVAAAGALIASASPGHPGTAAPKLTLAAEATASTAQWELYSALEGDRAAAHLGGLQLSASLTSMAQSWAAHLAAVGPSGLAHNPSLVAGISAIAPNWTNLGENVGYAGSIASVNAAYMASPDHRANILGAYSAVGVGVVQSGNLVYTVEDFVRTTDPLSGLGSPAPTAPPPPPVPTAVGALSGGSGVMDVLTVSHGRGSVVAQAVTGSSVGPSQSLGGIALGAPAGAALSGGDSVVAVRGVDNAVWLNFNQSGRWSGWSSLGGQTPSAPAVASVGGRVVVLVRGIDNQLWARTQANGQWGSWTCLGGVLTSGPGAGSVGEQVVVAVRGSDSAIWTGTLTNGSWSGWRGLGGRTSLAPAVANTDTGAVIAVVGSDRAVWTADPFAGGWTGWYRVGGVVTAAPAAAGVGGGSVQVVVTGSDSTNVWSSELTPPTSWSGWRHV